MRKSIYAIVCFLPFYMLTFVSTNAQKDSSSVSFNVGADIVSRYIWRGSDIGRSPSIQPSIEITAGGFAIGYWGAVATSQFTNGSFSANQESDLYLSYTLKEMFTITLTDYFLSCDTFTNNHYYEFNENKTGHLLEATLSFNGTENIPFSFLVATNVWGADARKANGDKFYSTYSELSYKTSIKDVELNAFVGANLIAPNLDKDESGYYGDYMGVVNLGLTGTKEIKVTEKFTMPCFVSLITNPQTENIFMVLGITF